MHKALKAEIRSCLQFQINKDLLYFFFVLLFDKNLIGAKYFKVARKEIEKKIGKSQGYHNKNSSLFKIKILNISLSKFF